MNIKKLDLRILKTKKNLYAVFEELMKSQSFEDIKVADICSKAMINRSTFYAHYNDKYELLSEYINSLKSTLSNELEKNSSIRNVKEYYMEMIKILLNHIELKKDTYAAVMINNKNSITMDILYDVVNKDLIKHMEEFGEDKNTFIPEDIISRFYLGAVISICTEWIVSKKYSKDDILSYFEVLIPDKLIN